MTGRFGHGGGNSSGQLGDGTTANSSTPVKVGGLTGVTAISAGNNDSIAIKSDGTVWAWGWNWYGQLGNTTTIGTNTDNRTPVKVIGLP